MPKLSTSIACFSLCAVMATAQGGKDTSPKIEGTWAATSLSFNAKKLPEEVIEKLMVTLSFKDGKYVVKIMGKEDESGTYKIDTKKKPIQIDVQITEGTDKGKTQFGLIKIEGDILTFAASKHGSKDRPEDFEGGEDIVVAVLKRSK